MFKQLKSQEIPNLNATFYEFEHAETKAKHYHLKCDDKNNGFLVLFNTLPYSNNGVMHILEHCVLAGSRDFDMADPFYSILKQSLQTFMNAMTDEDNTIYPFTTQNKKDYFNLMHIYTNAVFFPKLAKEVFMREGWRYEFEEIDNPESKLKLNGVVYNEMLGRLSSPYTRLWNAMMEALYPDTVYAYEPGGEPLALPELSYEEFKAYHTKYYHPSNAIFITCGDIDVAEIQKELEKNTLNEFSYQEVEFVGQVNQTPFTQTQNKTVDFPYAEDDYEENNYYCKMFHLSDGFDLESYISADFIRRLIASDSSSVVTKALEESGLVKNVDCMLNSNVNNTYFSITAEGVKLDDIERIDTIITKTLKDVVANGISQELIEKELHQAELANRSMRDNIQNAAYYTLNVITRFQLAKVNNPELYLNPAKGLDILKQKLLEENFINNFVKEKLLENNFSVNLTFKANPEKGAKDAQEIENFVASVEQNLTTEDKKIIIEEALAVEQYSNKEYPGKLPEFSTADIPADFSDFRSFETLDYKGTTIHAYKLPTNGVSYVNKSGYIKGFKVSDLGYLGLYQLLFSKVGSGERTYEQEDEFAYSISAGINFDIKINEDRYDASKVYLRADIGAKSLHENAAKVRDFMADKLTDLRFDEKDRIISYLEKTNLETKKEFAHQGNSISLKMASAKLAPTHNIISYFNGIEFDMFLNKLVKQLKTDENVFDNLITKLKECHNKVLNALEESILLVIDEEDHIEDTIAIFFDDSIISTSIKTPITNDVMQTNTDVMLSAEASANYCTMAINAPYRDHELAGAYAVLSTIISSEFAYPLFREKRGAYDAWAFYSPNNETFCLQTYMDPGLTDTFEGFKILGQWLENIEISDKQIEEGILQVIARFDVPLANINKCVQATERHLDDVEDHEITELRAKILNTTHKQVKRVINELILPKLDSAEFTAFANKQQYINEKLNLNTISFS